MTPIGLPAETPLAFRAVRGGVWVAASSYWNLGFGFLSAIVLTRLLGPEAFGIFALSNFFSHLFKLQPKLCLTQTFAQYPRTDEESLGTFAILEVLAALGSIVLLLAAIPILLALGYSPLVVQVSVVLGAGGLIYTLSGIAGVLLEKELRFGSISLIQSITFPLSYVPAFLMAAHGWGVWSLVAQNLLYGMMLAISVWWISRRQLPHLWSLRWRWSRRVAGHYLRFGLTMGLGMVAGMLLGQLDSFFIGTFVSVAMLGYYDRANRIAQWPGTLLNSIVSRTAFFTYARLQDDKARLEKAAGMILWLISLVGIPMALVIFITAPDLIALLYGHQWLAAAPFVRILVVISLVKPLWDNAWALFTAIGRPRLSTTFTVVGAATLALVGLPMTLLWGAMGTAAAVGLAFLVGLILVYHYARQVLSNGVISILAPPAVVSLVVLAGAMAINRLTDINELALALRVLIKVCYTGGAFFALQWMVQPRTTAQRSRYLIRLVRGK